MKNPLHCFTRYFVALAVMALLPVPGMAEPRPSITHIEPPRNILFVGNSFSFYNNGIHNQIRAMLRAEGQETGSIRSLTLSGATLSEHAAALPAILATENWDVVILQGHSMEAIDATRLPGFRRAVRDYAARIAARGATPVLFMTWSRTHIPSQIDALDANYTGIGNETGAFVVPVGLAFDRSVKRGNGIVLRIGDRRHPTLAGTYLAACTFYAAMFDRSPVGHPYTAGLEPPVAAELQAVALETVNDYYGRHADETGP